MCYKERAVWLLEGHEELIHFLPAQVSTKPPYVIFKNGLTDQSDPTLLLSQAFQQWLAHKLTHTLVVSAQPALAHLQIHHSDAAMP